MDVVTCSCGHVLEPASLAATVCPHCGRPVPDAITRAIQEGRLSVDDAARFFAQALDKELRKQLHGPERPPGRGPWGWLRRLFSR
jgi:predicted RNA-binding Zn-ribbon protein involved in translation (DUF1610 family)